MQGILLLTVWLALFAAGLRAPFAFGLGYLWVDLFTPQLVDPGVMDSFPVSLIMGAAAVGSYLLVDGKAPPGLRLGIVLTVLWAVWITMTTLWAEVPDAAWVKWDWAYKTVLFSAFIPFMFRSRVQIEAAILVIALSISAHGLAFGVKTLFSGGGYGARLGLVVSNSGFGESSTLAVDCVAILPLLAWLSRHSVIVPRWRFRGLGFLALSGAAVLGALGTYARAGLVALGVFAVFYWWASKRKVLLVVAFVVAAAGLMSFMGAHYQERMGTILHPLHDQSAGTRLAVWDWTWHYALEHPLGGGFDVYRIASADVVIDGVELADNRRAFHSMYFEVLGEQGFVGLAIFLGMIATFFVSTWRVMRRARNVEDLVWLSDLAKAMLVSAVPYFCGAAFIGVAFQPYHYELFALAVALLNHYTRATRSQRTTALAEAVPRRGLPARA